MDCRVKPGNDELEDRPTHCHHGRLVPAIHDSMRINVRTGKHVSHQQRRPTPRKDAAARHADLIARVS
jgi:hypothetical protein